MDTQTRRPSFRPGSGGRGDDYPELDPKTRQMIFDVFKQDSRLFNAHLGLRLSEVRRGYARLEVENVPHLCQPAMVMHGGASFGMADAAVAYALIGLFGFGSLLLTVEMKINYLEPIPLGPVVAEAYVLRSSRKSAYAEVDVWAAGKLAARATTTYIIRPRPSPNEAPAPQEDRTGCTEEIMTRRSSFFVALRRRFPLDCKRQGRVGSRSPGYLFGATS